MKSKIEIITFLEGLQWNRMAKKELDSMFSEFFGVKMKGENSTNEECKDIDYSLVYTTTQEKFATSNFVDIEVYYLKMRNHSILITGVELLDYVE